MTTFLVDLLAVAMALSVPSVAYSQATPAPQAEPSLRTFLPDLADDVRRFPSNPVGISAAMGGILSSSLSSLDDDLAEWSSDPAFESGAWMGNGAVLAAGTLLTYGVGRWTHKPRVAHIAVDVLRAQVLSLGLVYPLKYAVGRERPDHSSHDSFPSGHTAQTFASATVLTRHLGLRAAWPAYGAAAYVAISRVNQQRHFLSDVVFGAGLGIAVGWNGARRQSNWTVSPSISPSRVSIDISRVSRR